MNLREWLIVVGVVIILGILIDGIRRMRMAKQDSLKMSRDLGGHIDSSPLDDDFNPELPGGGARVVSTGHDAVDDVEEDLISVKGERREEPLVESSFVTSEPPQTESHGVEESSAASTEDMFPGADPVKSEIAGKQKPAGKAKSKSKSNDTKASVEGAEHEVIVINVDARPGEAFSGVAIKNLLEACGLKHGDMSIFHRHEEEDLLSPIQFSVANAVEPGYFDPDSIEQMSTPGVSFFMSIPGPKDYLKAFEFMSETAKCFAENLHGELKDEHRSVLTSQTIEHCKQRIKEFERKQLCKARGQA